MLILFRRRMTCMHQRCSSSTAKLLVVGSRWSAFHKSNSVNCSASRSNSSDSTFEEEYRKLYEKHKGMSNKRPENQTSNLKPKGPSIHSQSTQLNSMPLPLKLDSQSHSQLPVRTGFDVPDAAVRSLTHHDILHDLNQIKGVGEKKAKDIFKEHGSKTPEILNSSLADAIKMLQAVPGIGLKTAMSIKEQWDQQKSNRDTALYLRTLGLDFETSALLMRKQWPDLRQRLENDPYSTLLDANPLVSFHTMDNFVGKLQGYEQLQITDSRLKAALICQLVIAHEEHQQTCVPWGKLSVAVAALLEEDIEEVQFRDRIMRYAVELSKETLQNSAGLVIDYPLDDSRNQEGELKEDCLCYLRANWEDENAIAHSIIQFVLAGAKKSTNSKEVIDLLRDSSNIQKLSPGQEQALGILSKSSIAIITGWPGSGKTFFLQSAVTLLQKASIERENVMATRYGRKKREVRFALCTPTGRAASKLAEQIQVPCKTIHRLLGTNWKGNSSMMSGSRQSFFYNERIRLFLHFLGVDEASMIDGNVFASLLKALPPDRTRLCIVGDPHQLPSVSSGQVLQDIIASKVVPVVDLRQVFRQAQGNTIIDQAHALLKGHAPDFEMVTVDNFQNFPERLESECVLVPVAKGAKMMEKIQSVVLSVVRRIARPGKVQVLCASKIGMAGTVGLNPELQDIFNPKKHEKQEALLEMYDHGRISLRTGDKVLHCKNDYKRNVFNGDIGVVVAISNSEVRVQFPGRSECVKYSIQSVRHNLQPAWALTVHKAQGGEYPIVVFALSPGANTSKEMLYTAITRAKEHLVVVGNPADLQNCMRATSAARCTGLGQKLERLRKKHQLPLIEAIVID